jgi:Na+/H+-dicarboxylate symporter
MTVIPLVFAGLVVGSASVPDARAIGRLGGRALIIFLILLSAAALFTILVAPIAFARLSIDPAAAAALRETAGTVGVEAAARAGGFPDLRQWLVELVPTNVIGAAAAGQLLPLIVFAVAAGVAIGRIGSDERTTVIRFFRGWFEAMLVLVRWILELAPIGVFALALPLAATLGVAAAGAVIFYIAVVVLICILFTLLLYPLAATLGRVQVRRFARATAPAQAVALSARSSLASLPAMIDGGTQHLAFPEPVRNFFLPLAASTFRIGGTIGIPAGVLFISRLYDIPLGPAELATVALSSVLITFSIPGVPAGSILVMAPILQSVGLPAEAIGILLGVDTIPDMFRTATNVTGDMTAATILTAYESS